MPRRGGMSRWVAMLACTAIVAWVLIAFGRFHQPGMGFTYVLDIGDGLGLRHLDELDRHGPYIHEGVPGYDATYYVQLALRPRVDDPRLLEAVDNLPYRGRRIMGPWLAWLAGMGDPDRVINAFTLLNLACWLALGALLFRWFPMRDTHDLARWAGVMLSAGMLGSLRHALSDGPAVLMVAAAVALAQGSRPWLAACAGAIGGLARETAVLVACVFVPQRWRPWRGWWMAVIAGAIVAGPVILWMLHLQASWGAASGGIGGSGAFSWPLLGFFERWHFVAVAIVRNGWEDPYWTSLLAHFGITVQLIWIVARPQWREAWWRVGAAHAALLLILGTAVWEGYPGAASRALLPLLLAFNVLAPRTRAGLALVLAGNLGLFAGIKEMHPPPEPTAVVSGPSGLVIDRVDGRSVQVVFSRDFRAPESFGGHAWRWLSSNGSMEIRTPRARALRMAVRLGLRAPSNRVVALRMGERELWSGEVGEKLKLIDLGTLVVPAGGAVIEVITGPPDAARGDQAPLAVGIFDMRVEVLAAVDDP